MLINLANQLIMKSINHPLNWEYHNWTKHSSTQGYCHFSPPATPDTLVFYSELYSFFQVSFFSGCSPPFCG